VFADAELRQRYLLALLTRDARVWHERTGIHAMRIGPDDAIAVAQKTAQRRKLLRVRDERIRLGLRVKKLLRPTGSWSSTERPDAFTTAAACIVCDAPVDLAERPSGTCSKKCFNAVRQFKRKTARAEHRMVNESTDPQPQPVARYSDPPAIPMPPKTKRTSGLPRGSDRRVA
jgi:hypothetical protein